ncbi:hypothetical protein HN51_057313, partial [Arachis hypogaea]
AAGYAIVVFRKDATFVTTMIHQPDFSVTVGDSSQNDEDDKNPPGYNVMVLEALSALESNLNAIVNFIECPKNPKEMNGSYKDDFTPTSFVSKAGYHALIEVFGEKDYLVGTPDELKFALSESFSAWKLAVINVIVNLIQV